MFNFDRFESRVKEKGLNNAYLCKLVGKTKSYTSDMKRQGRVPTDDVIAVWADALNTTPEYLCGETDIKEKGPVPIRSKAEIELLNECQHLSNDEYYKVIEYARLLVSAHKK